MSAMTCPHGGSAVAFRPPLTRRSGTFHLLAGLLLGAGFLITVDGGESLTAAERKYEAAGLRTKKAMGKWPGIDGTERRYIRRMESGGGRWALEYMEGPEEGEAFARVFDSAGTEIWAGRVGDRLELSVDAPAFASLSSFNPILELYSVDLSPNPVYRDPHFPVRAFCQSPEGIAFAFVGPSEILLLSTAGWELGRIPLSDSTVSVLSVALSPGGRHVAVGWSILTRSRQMVEDGALRPLEPRPGEPGPVALDGDGQGRSDSGDHARADDIPLIELGAPTPAEGKGTISFRYGVSVFDRTGAIMGEFETPGRWAATHRIALSGASPPSVAIVDAKGASLWTARGDLIWQDSVAFVGSMRALPRAVHVTEDGALFVVTSRREAESRFWAWGSDGIREAELALPRGLNPQRRGARFCDERTGSISIQTFLETMTLTWTSK